MPLQAGIGDAVEATQLKDHPFLTRVDHVEAAGQPQRHQHAAKGQHAPLHRATRGARRRGAAVVVATSLATQYAGQLVVEVAEKLVEIGRPVIAAPTSAPLRVVLCHGIGVRVLDV